MNFGFYGNFNITVDGNMIITTNWRVIIDVMVSLLKIATLDYVTNYFYREGAFNDRRLPHSVRKPPARCVLDSTPTRDYSW